MNSYNYQLDSLNYSSWLTKEYYTSDRHISVRDINGDYSGKWQRIKVFDWRAKDKIKTVSGALVVCLNIGVDPPDAIDSTDTAASAGSTQPNSTLECWIDTVNEGVPTKTLESIGLALQQQYEIWQPKAKYKQCLDPTNQDIKKLCQLLRKSSGSERILFHLNGHGVPRPTSNGEIWVFNKTYTQYIPLSIYDLHCWLESPSLIVLDCNSAGTIVEAYQHFVKQKNEEEKTKKTNQQTATTGTGVGVGGGGATLLSSMANTANDAASHSEDESSSSGGPSSSPSSSSSDPSSSSSPSSTTSFDSIILAACSSGEMLPSSPDFPGDLFTCCLTTPLKIALRFFASTSLLTRLTSEQLDSIPGKENDRKTPLGELNWIFTAITDTIAWNILPRDLFQTLFRSDLLVASLFRNYLLAIRIMKTAGHMNPVSVPSLPPNTHKHPMWQSWDLIVESYLLQLDKYVKHGIKFKSSSFFAENLSAFEVWLEVGSESQAPPMQLPIVLQVLLAQAHRRRALVLLARFCGKGSWAVNQALSVGIFPYVLKLLQSPAPELREVLVFIWTKLLALDKSCREEIIKEKCHLYFLNYLSSSSSTATAATSPPPPSAAGAAAAAGGQLTDRQRVMCAFILTVCCDRYPPGQNAILACNIWPIVRDGLVSESSLVRRWMCLWMAKLWDEYEEAKQQAQQQSITEKLCNLVADPVPEVRAACLYALGTFMGIGKKTNNNQEKNTATGTGTATATTSTTGSTSASTSSSPLLTPSERFERISFELSLGRNFSQLVVDASPLVREELVIALKELVESQKDEFTSIAHDRIHLDEMNSPPHTPAGHHHINPSHASTNTNTIHGGGNSKYGHTTGVMGMGVIGGGNSTTMNLTSSRLHAVASHPNLSRAVSEPPTSLLGPTHFLGPIVSSTSILPSPPPSASPSQSPYFARSPSTSGSSTGPTTSTATTGSAFVSGGIFGGMLNSTASTSAAALVTVGTTGAGVTSANSPITTSVNNRNTMRDSPPLSSPPSVSSTTSSYPSYPPAAFPSSSSSTATNPTTTQPTPHQQRVLIWRVIRTLCHDPFPGVARAALALRRLVITRGFANETNLNTSASVPVEQSLVLDQLQEMGLIGAGGLGGGGAIGMGVVETTGQQQGGVGTGGAGGGSNMNSFAATTVGNPSLVSGSRPPATTPTTANNSGNYSTPQRPRSRPVSVDISPHPVLRRASSYHIGVHGHRGSLNTTVDGRVQIGGHEHHHTSDNNNNSSSSASNPVSSPPPSTSFPPSSSHPSSTPIPSLALPCVPTSTIYPRSCDYFAAPITDPVDDPDVALAVLLNREWRLKRNLRRVHLANTTIRKDVYDVNKNGPFEQTGVIQVGFDSVANLLFHPYENILVATDNKRTISLWDYTTYEKMNQFSNENSRGSKITSLQFVNAHAISLLCSATDDGVIRLWRNSHLKENVEIVSAWIAIRNLPTPRAHPGVITEWQPRSGHLLVSGHTDVVRIWDVEREICVLDVPLESHVDIDPHYVNSLCSSSEGSIIWAGCGDGGVRMFDPRCSIPLISTITKHQSSVVKIHLQRGGEEDGKLVSSGITGDVHVIDLRLLGGPAAEGAIGKLNAFEKNGVPLDAFACHDYAPIYASGSRKQIVRVADTFGSSISQLKYHKGFMGHRIGPVTTLAFHPNKLILAAGAMNPFISIMAVHTQ